MIIPVRCFTCGKVLGNKWAYVQREMASHATEDVDDSTRATNEETAGPEADSDPKPKFEKSKLGTLMDDLGLRRICCRRHILSHVDLIDII